MNPSIRHFILRSVIPPLIPLFILTLAAEILVRSQIVPSYLLPAPSQVLTALLTNTEEFARAALETLASAAAGLGLSVILGVGLALVFSSSSFLGRALYPYAVFFQTVPLIAIAPLLVIWFGFGAPTVIAASLIASVFPVIANTLAGLWSADHELVELFRLYGAGRFAVLFKLRLPSALPQIFTGIRIAGGLAMIGAIVGEFIAGGGLGGLIDAARVQQRVDKVFAAVLIASFAGIIITASIHCFAFLTKRKSTAIDA
jgi:NitT/TauT family transport system permease protein